MLKRKNKGKLVSPYTGEFLSISEVNDPVFASKSMGDGFAVKLTDGKVVSPVDGKVTMCFPTYHAYGITTKEGVEILLHIGIDTVSLNGHGFQSAIKVGQKVKVGDVLCNVDIEYIESRGLEITSMCIFTNREIKVTKAQLQTASNEIDFITICTN